MKWSIDGQWVQWCEKTGVVTPTTTPEMLIGNIEGVQSVVKTEFKNLCGGTSGYSPNSYDITGATKNKQIYPSLDPSIFEFKFPDRDIRGRVV